MTEAENVHHKMGNGCTRISPSLIYVSEFDFRELKHKTRIFGTRTFSFPTHFPALLSRDFLNSRGTYIYSLLISIVKYMYKRPSLLISIVKYMYKRLRARARIRASQVRACMCAPIEKFLDFHFQLA